VTLVLSGGTVVLSLDPPRIVDADVAIDGDRVVQLGPAIRAGAGERVDCSSCLVIPGNVCGHTHLYSALARGMPWKEGLEPPADFVQILQRVWWRLDRALDEEGVRESALVGGMEALLAGTTTLVDHHASPNAIDGSLDVIAGALEDLGVRSILCYETTDRDGPDRARAGVEENRRFLTSVSNGAHRRARGMVGAHASFTLSEETLAACVDVAREAGAGIHIHVAEDAADQGDCTARFAMPVVDRLTKAGALTDRALLAHCVHLHPSEVALIGDAGATVAHNARSNMNNAVGRAPVAAFQGTEVLGTDGIGADMFAESQAAYWRAREDDVFDAPDATMRRLANGARFAGPGFDEPALGRIEPGAPADVTVLDYAPPTPLTADNLAWHWMFGLSAGRVRDVIVAGDVVVRDRRLARVDQGSLVARASKQAEALWERMGEIGPHPFEPQGRP
jgi:putative selenium metabolism protein SsnA